jgi:hypothetical protein
MNFVDLETRRVVVWFHPPETSDQSRFLFGGGQSTSLAWVAA